MVDVVGLVGIGIAAFAATDIDDLFVLILFFSHPNFTARQVVLGQYLGIASLIAASAVASLVSLVIPAAFVGLMGVIPIAIGIKKLVETRKPNDDEDQTKVQTTRASASYLRFLTVAAITIANGGDNIGVYVPLFASGGLGDMAILIAIFLAITGVWCAMGYYLAKHRVVASRFSRLAGIVLPFVLIMLGVFILLDAFVLA